VQGRWLNIKECWKDLQRSGMRITYWLAWRLIRLHCPWQKVGGQVMVQENDWRYFKSKLLSGWRPPGGRRGK